jgi:probable phosphoglycerate mutase
LKTTNLIIARHGNTFASGETPRRVGARTDIPLVDSGREQAVNIGKYLRHNNLLPDVVYSSNLSRTRETAKIASLESGINCAMHKLDIFNEIDYGPDENKTEEEVIARIGKNAIEDWNESATVPPGWNVAPKKIIEDWKSFADMVLRDFEGKNILVVTSNGIARFAPHILNENSFENFRSGYKLKISTGSICLFSYIENEWQVAAWNLKP